MAAASFGLTIRSTRAIERTWRNAMAVDAARAGADDRIFAVLRAAARPPSDPTATAALGAVGDETSTRLSRFEADLDRRRILDDRTSALRDEMVDALRFRRLQLSPARMRLGDSPLRHVEGELAHRLDRWGMRPTAARPVVLASAEPALASLRRSVAA